MKGVGNRQKKVVVPKRIHVPAKQRPVAKKPRGGKRRD
jgi:hypothetical protein